MFYIKGILTLSFLTGRGLEVRLVHLFELPTPKFIAPTLGSALVSSELICKLGTMALYRRASHMRCCLRRTCSGNSY